MAPQRSQAGGNLAFLMRASLSELSACPIWNARQSKHLEAMINWLALFEASLAWDSAICMLEYAAFLSHLDCDG